MHTTLVDACALAADVAKASAGCSDREVVLSPPFTVLSEVSHVIQDSDIILAGQNVCWEPQGAFTGEISPVMLKDAGAGAAIIGHSERRQIFAETNEMINKRVKGALDYGLMAIFCIGETLDERESGNTFSVLEEQIRGGLADVSAEQMDLVVIAYELSGRLAQGRRHPRSRPRKHMPLSGDW